MKFNLTALIHRTALVAFLGIIIYSCRTNSAVSDHLPPCAITHGLDSLLTQIFPDNGAPGGIAIVMHNDTVIYRHACGLANLVTGDAITDSTIFNLSSASKIFTSVALLKLSEDGRLSLDDCLSKYFPELTGDFFRR